MLVQVVSASSGTNAGWILGALSLEEGLTKVTVRTGV